MINKVFTDFDEAVADIPDGASIAAECWGYPATPQNLIAAVKRKGTKDLTIITHTFIPMVYSEEDAVLPSLLLCWRKVKRRGLSRARNIFSRSR
jgi:hypothetical protein